MNFLELAKARYSVRAYKSDPVPEELLQQVLEAARLAPTAVSRQPFQILVVHTAGRKEEILKFYPREWLVQAPLLIGICTLPGEAWVRKYDQKNYAEVDATIAFDHLIMAATDAGLGTCWIAAFDPQAARQIFNLPPNVEPLLFTPLGYPAGKPGHKPRKSLDALIRYERWA
ncbi:MAG: nitroreductase [Candidatus Firestonebacteria bacterium]|nr:nitroreductase [Candidatus Firestonebacteria bacterium]